jgi:hypothetical protein
MQHLPALDRETPKNIDIRPFVSRTVASWILSLLMATWPEGAGTDKSRRARSKRNLIPPWSWAEKNRYVVKQGRHLR